jgi:hypothetical protein
MPVIQVNKVVDRKEYVHNRKKSKYGGGEAQGVADPKKIIQLEFIAFM